MMRFLRIQGSQDAGMRAHFPQAPDVCLDAQFIVRFPQGFCRLVPLRNVSDHTRDQQSVFGLEWSGATARASLEKICAGLAVRAQAIISSRGLVCAVFSFLQPGVGFL